jgi:hypothetical protein
MSTIADNVIHCRGNAAEIKAQKPWELGKPVTFMYMPAGQTRITAGFRSGSITIAVSVDESTADTIQSSFDSLRSSAPKQKPFGCVEHREQEASVHPTGFQWGEHQGDLGVIICAEPTELGAKNVNGRVHRSWSPSFTTDADYGQAVCGKCDKGSGSCGCASPDLSFPDGVRGSESNPAKVTGIDFCVGTLTNKPAFRNMPAVKARQADGVTAGAPAGNQNAAGPHKKHAFSVTPDTSGAHDHWRKAIDAEGSGEHEKAIGHHEDALLSYRRNQDAIDKRRGELFNGMDTADDSAKPDMEAEYDTLKHLHRYYDSQAAFHDSEMERLHNKRMAKHRAITASVKAQHADGSFDASGLLDVARALRVAHWNADTTGTEHEALGELYEAWESGMDTLVEATCGKRGCKVMEPSPGNASLTEQALAALEAVKTSLDCEADADLCNIVADMENAVNKGKYLLKAKEAKTMTANDILKSSVGGQPGNQNAAGPHAKHSESAFAASRAAYRSAAEMDWRKASAQQHKDAYDAHVIAEGAHRIAEKSAKDAGPDHESQAALHSAYVEQHMAQSKFHLKMQNASEKAKRVSASSLIKSASTILASLPVPAQESIIDGLRTPAEKVLASGTSEGAKKGWVSRIAGVHNAINESLAHLDAVPHEHHDESDRTALENYLNNARGRLGTAAAAMKVKYTTDFNVKDTPSTMKEVHKHATAAKEGFRKLVGEMGVPEAQDEHFRTVEKYLDMAVGRASGMKPKALQPLSRVSSRPL